MAHPARQQKANFLRAKSAARRTKEMAVFARCTIIFVSMLTLATTGRRADAQQPIESIARLDLPASDRTALAVEDKQRDREGLPTRFAIAHTTAIRLETDGTWETLPDGTFLWRVRVSSEGATSINLGFTRFQLPTGAQLTIASLTNGRTIGPFTDFWNNPRGQLWTPVIGGSDVVVTLAVPKHVRDLVELEIGSINVGYRPFSAPILLSGACNVDVACPEAEPWRDQVHSVGLLSVSGTLICSGAMLNNTANDLRPLFLTANHCGVTPGNAASVVVYWNYENSTCRAPGSPESGAPGDGPLSMFQSGATLRASSALSSDFTLIELDAPPDPAWDVTYAGWSRANQATTSSAGIHHPGTNEKRISIDADPSSITSYVQAASPGDGTHLRIADWDLGTTEAGSSGSPLFDQNYRVVGQLHGGFTACGNDDAIWYGRLAVSWNGEGTPSTRLSDWLDPLATGAPGVDHVSSGGLAVVPSGDVLHIGKVGGPFTNNVATYTLTNATSSLVDFEVSLTNSFGLLLDGGTANVSGTLAADGGLQSLEVSVGPDVNSLPAGTYTENIVFSDLTNSLSRTRVHVVEVGRTLFSVTPTAGLDAGGPAGGPFPDASTYTVTSERPTPVQVLVTSSESWVSLNGGTAPITMNLGGVGDSQMVSVGFSTAANDLPIGTYHASVSFTNQSGGDGGTHRDVTLYVGRIVRTSTDTPQPINDFATIISTINVPEARCIGDLDVEMDITHTYIGDLIIDLESPIGTVVRLHNGTGGSSDNIVATYDDESFAPDGPGLLSDFDGESTAGNWKLTITDTGFPDSGSLNHWALRFEPASGNCPASQLIYSFPLNSDPGWTRQGLWGFGQPTGGGTHNRDPNQGNTGINVFGYNLSGDYANNMSTTQYLTTFPMDCSAIGRTRLKFRRWLGIDSANFDHANIQVSANGTNWTDVWQHATGAIAETSWSLQSYDISAVADGHSTVFLRWGMGPTNALNTYPGWNIDDIEIWGAPQPTTCNQSIPANTCCIAEAPTAEPAPVKHNRYISMVPGNTSRSTALRVQLVSLHHPDPPNAPNNPPPNFSTHEGEIRWVGPPLVYPDSEVHGTSFVAAVLQCTPHYADFGSRGQIYVYGNEIVPDSIYQVQAVVEPCGAAIEPLFSSPLELETGRWGDVVAPFQMPSPAGLSQPNISDITAVVDKFRDRAGAVTKPRAQLQGNSVNPGATVTIAEIAAAVDGFKGLAYPYSGPTGFCGD